IAEAFRFLELLSMTSPAARARAGATLSRAASELKATAPVWRRPELLSGFPFAAELVVGGALLGILQDFVGLLDFLEFRLRVLLFADVGVKFASQAPVRFLDFVRGCGAGHAENFVVVAIFHESLQASIEPLKWGQDRVQARGLKPTGVSQFLLDY